MKSFEADQILARSREAQPAWAALGARRRCAILGRLRREIARHCESIATSIARETAKPLLDALSGDVLVTLEMIRYCETQTPKILRARRIGKPAFFFRGARFKTQFEPHGVALVFGPSNYPLQLSLVPLVTALAAGNTVILKCSEHTPETAALITSLCAQVDLTPGIVQVLHDGPEESVALIDARPDIIFFTGSSANGQQVAERAAKHLIPVILELGGKDAAIIFADCHLERAVEGITYGAFANSGRVCVGIKRAYVEAPIYDEFLARLTQRMASLQIGTGPDADLIALSGRPASALRAQIEDALARGAMLHSPHDRIGSEPVLLTNVPADARILTEECFGPALCVKPFKSEAEALALANGTPFALSGTIWTRNRDRARRVATQLSAGSCAINDVIRVIANPRAPFGGNGRSGYGRYHGPEGLRALSRTRTIMRASDRRRREVNWFPFTSRTRRQLAGLIRFLHGSTGLSARLNRLLFRVVLAGIVLISARAQSQQNHLSVDVQLTPDARGELAYLVFNTPAGFPGDRQKAIRHGFLSIPANAQRLRVETDLPPGTYAISLYEDLNGNRKLDRNMLGIPREPVGASNNPPSRLRAPRFSECSFRMGSAPETISITMVRGS